MKNEWKELFKTFSVYFVSLLTGMVLLSLLMNIDIFSGVRVFYYSTLYNAVISVIIVACILFILKKIKFKYVNMTINLIFSSTLLVGMALFLFVTLAPLTIDRSYTIFMLSDMSENAQHTFTKEEVEDRFSDIYIYSYDSMEKRIEEQLSIGNIKESDKGYQISEKGKRLVKIFRFVEKFYPVKDERIIYPEYK